MRFVVGAFSTEPGDRDPLRGRVPYGGRPVPFHGATVWAVEHGQSEVRRCPDSTEHGDIVAFGTCLGTFRELDEAREALDRGQWARATELPGSYLTLARHGDTIRVIGDRAGVHTVYWVHQGPLVLWSTSSTVLASYVLSSPSLPRLLAGMTLSGVDHLADAGYFDGVHRVPPGQALELIPSCPPRIVSAAPPRPSMNLTDAAPTVTAHLSTAVQRRMASVRKASADLSGGVDSSAVTVLAAARTPLLAVTYTDGHLADQDDIRYARRIAAQSPGITHVQVDGTSEKAQHFDDLDDATLLPLTDIPSLSLGLLGIKRAQLAPALAHGSSLHLTGRGGDNVLDATPLSIVEFARVQGRRAAAHRAAAFARARRTSPRAVAAQAARTARTTMPEALAGLAAELASPASGGPGAFLQPRELLQWCGTLPAAHWLTPDGRRAVSDIVAARAHAVTPETPPWLESERIALERMGEEHATYDQISRQLWDLPIHAPYLDTPVVDACLAVPSWQRWVPGDYKPLARAALTGAVPAFLFERRTKTPMTRSLHYGLRTNYDALRDIIVCSQLAEAELIDPAPALAALDSAARGEPAPLGSLHQLIATELWLSTTPVSRGRWWARAHNRQETA
ncbi:asparagine synthase-related protein [Streptomyces sp. NPDC058583]|uniref:asparagine synthase-related protein n=1 Tax=unclassified Streptomyces TaxID=2593676 RepID=UPI003664E2A3